MSLAEAFDGPALIPFVMAGDPSPEECVDYAEALAKGDADVIELGIPFSDPMADGPTIQRAHERGLDAGVDTDGFFDVARDVRDATGLPLVALCYYNLVYRRGSETFLDDCAEAGIEGVVVPDLPVEEAGDLLGAADGHPVDPIFLVAPTTSDERMRRIGKAAEGFLYLVARLGVTGAKSDLDAATEELLGRARENVPGVPKAVGFGVSRGEHARQLVEAGADGVIAGSVFVDLVEGGDPGGVRRKAEELRRGIDAGTVQREVSR